MAKYSDIKGFTVQTVSSDPVASQVAGGAWASAAAVNTARNSTQGAGTQDAAWLAGGSVAPPAITFDV